MIKIIKELEKKLNINTHYPNYIYKPIFDIFFLCIVFVFLFIGSAIGWDFNNHYSISCPYEAPCLNPFYVCGHLSDFGLLDYYNLDCEKFNSFDCKNNICDSKYIQPSQTIGQARPNILDIFYPITFILILTAFLSNHLLYKWRRKE